MNESESREIMNSTIAMLRHEEDALRLLVLALLDKAGVRAQPERSKLAHGLWELAALAYHCGKSHGASQMYALVKISPEGTEP